MQQPKSDLEFLIASLLEYKDNHPDDMEKGLLTHVQASLYLRNMIIGLVTKDDLQSFRTLLMNDMKDILNEKLQLKIESLHGYKTSEVREILGCSVNKIVSLRITRNLRTKKVGGTLYYNKDDIKKLVEEGY
jgi:hypothetical protein